MSSTLRSPRPFTAVFGGHLGALSGAVACLLAFGPGAAWAAERVVPTPAVELRGRVTQPDSTPLPRARITMRVTRASSVTCDDSGRFRTTLKLPSVAALERGPWIAQLDGSAQGWRLVYGDGGPSLGLELSLERSAAGTRVVARSNDERLAPVAAAAVARSEARALDGLRFLALGGERSGIPPAPHLTVRAAVAIESSEPAVASPAPAASPPVTPSGTAPPPVVPSTTAPVPAASSPAAKPIMTPRSSMDRADSLRRESARADSLRRAKARTDREAKSARTATGTGAVTTKASRRSKPAASGRDSLTVVVRDSIAPGAPRTNQPRPADDRVHGVNPDPPIGPSSPPVVPRANTELPEPPGPIVNPPRDPPRHDEHPCTCRFGGTVEMVASSLLERPEQIVIRLEDSPAIADTVELYVGAPRSFRLERVPCGSRRLRIDRLDPGLPAARIVTGQAMRGFACSNGQLLQPRLVIALDRARRR